MAGLRWRILVPVLVGILFTAAAPVAVPAAEEPAADLGGFELLDELLKPSPGDKLFQEFADATSDSRRLRRLLRLPQVAGGPAALARAKRELASEISDWAPGSLERALPPREQNAAPDLEEIERILRAKPLDDLSRDALFRAEYDPAQLPVLRKVLAERTDLIQAAHRAVSRLACVAPSDPAHPPGMFSSLTGGLRQAKLFLDAESILRVADGRGAEAVSIRAKGIRIAEHTASATRGLIGYLSAWAYEGSTVAGLGRILGLSGPDGPTADTLAAVLAEPPRLPSLRQALREEAVTMTAMVDRWREEVATRNQRERQRIRNLFDAMEALYLDDMRQLLQAADLPYLERIARFHQVEANVQAALLREGILHALRNGAPANSAYQEPRSCARIAVVLAAAQVMAYRARQGAWPETLAQAAPNPPTSPLTGKPAEYRREGDGFVVWIAGPSGVFDPGPPGTLIPGGVPGFRYPVPRAAQAPAPK